MTTCKYCDEDIVWIKNYKDEWIAADPAEDNDYNDDPQWHNCSGSGRPPRDKNKITYCNSCDAEIYFSENYKSLKTGKFIPVDAETDQPHRCDDNTDTTRRFVVKCKYCGLNITFSNNEVSESGKKIPLNAGSLTYHRCSKKMEKEVKE